jgi:hypothetical protein
MNPEQKEQLENEQIKGSKAQHTYDSFIKDFVEEKRVVLFDTFRALPLSAESELMEVKRMLYAVDTLDDEIRAVIQTGQMASQVLNESNEEVTH